MELESLPGMGPGRAAKLREAGIQDVKAFAEADLRKVGPIEGVSSDAFRKHKAAARRLLDKEGVAYDKAPYRKDGKTARKPRAATVEMTARSKPQVAEEPRTQEPAPQPKRRGLLARILGR